MLNVDATRNSQAFTGGGYVQQIVGGEVNAFVKRVRATATPCRGPLLPLALQPDAGQSWFGAVSEVVNVITMLSIVHTGAAPIRERETGPWSTCW